MATTEIGGLRISLSLDSSSFLGGLVEAQRSIANFARSVENQFAKLNDEINRFSAKLTAAITLPAALTARAAINAASNAEEMQSAFEYTFGKMAQDVESWSERTGDAIGRATEEMQEGALAFQQMFRVAAPTEEAAAGLSKQFALLTQDLSSFYNVGTDVALMKLRSALQGENEPIRDFGVFMTEAAVAEEAVRMGAAKTTKAVSEQAKILARANIILRETVTAQGDASRTSGSYANQVRALQAQFAELGVKIGKILLPFAEKLVTVLTRLVTWFTNLPDWVHNSVVAVAAFAAALGPLLVIMKGLVIFFTARWIMGSFGLLGSVLSVLIAPIQTFVTTIAGLALRFVSLQGVLKLAGGLLTRLGGPIAVATTAFLVFRDYVIPVLQQLWEKMNETLGPRLQAIFTALEGVFAKLQSGPVGAAISWLIKALGVLLDVVGTVTAFIVSEIGKQLIKALELVLIAIKSVVEAISSMVDLVNAVFAGDWQRAWTAAGGIVDAITGGWIESLGVFSKEAEHSLRSVYTSAKKWLVDEFSKLGSGLSRIIESMVSAFRTRFPEIGETAQAAYGETKKWLVEALGPVAESVGKFVNRVIELWHQFKMSLGLGSAGTSVGKFIADQTKPATSGERKPPAAVAEEKKKKKGASGPTDEDRARNAADEQRRLDEEIIRAKLDLETDARKRAMLEKQLLDMERAAFAEDLRRRVADRELAQKNADALLRAYDEQLNWRQHAVINRQLDADLRGEELASLQQRLDAERDMLNLQGDLARTEAERRVVALRLLDIDYQLERAKLLAVEANKDLAASTREDAQRARMALDSRYQLDRDKTMRATAGPMESYLDGIPKTVGEINEQLEEMAVDRLRKIEDGFAGIAQKVLGVNGELGKTLSMLFRIVAQQAILAVNNGSGFSGFLSGLGNAFGTAFGGSGSSAGSAAASSGFNTTAGWFKRGWAKGGGGVLGGLPGIDSNMLSLNGDPIARVTRGESLSVTPKGGGRGAVSVTVHADLRGAAPEAVTAIGQRLDVFERSLPQTIVRTVGEAQGRRMLG